MTTAAALAALDQGMTSRWAFRNRLINGNFGIWQRATIFASPASASYTADRWKIHYDGTGAFTVSRQAAESLNTPGYALKWDQTGAVVGGSYRTLQQPIESVKTLAGKRMAISFKAKATGFTSLPVYISQVFGTGGAPSATVDTLVDTVTLSGTLEEHKIYVDVPTIAGKTLGSNGDDYLAVSFNLPTSGTFDVTLEEVQVEEGVVTPFEVRPPEVELSLCQRYFQHVFTGWSGEAISGNLYRGFATTPVCMRKAPTCVSVADGPVSGFPAGSAGDITAWSAGTATYIQAERTASGTANAQFASLYAMSADF